MGAPHLDFEMWEGMIPCLYKTWGTTFETWAIRVAHPFANYAKHAALRQKDAIASRPRTNPSVDCIANRKELPWSTSSLPVMLHPSWHLWVFCFSSATSCRTTR